VGDHYHSFLNFLFSTVGYNVEKGRYGRTLNPARSQSFLRLWNTETLTLSKSWTPLVYRELHRLAVRYVANERPGHTLQANRVSQRSLCPAHRLEKYSVAESSAFCRGFSPADAACPMWPLRQVPSVCQTGVISTRYPLSGGRPAVAPLIGVRRDGIVGNWISHWTVGGCRSAWKRRSLNWR
jgi:hypothetical protein